MEATCRLERHVASVHRGMVFLEHEHLTLLAGLHVEITKLKRRCQELSCELDSRFPHRTTAEDEAELASRCEAAQRLLEERRGATAAARGELRLGGARASQLGRSLRRDERHFLEELKRRSHKITMLNRELQRQKGATAALCRQLDAARAQLRNREEAGPRTPEDEDGPRDEEGGAERLPSPPPGRRPSARPGVRAERVRACVPRERVTSPQRPGPMPDPALFLVPPRYRLLRWSRPIGLREGGADDWEDADEGGGLRGRVDMGGAEGETAL
ncbi:coiled-coil domain-containing 92B-like isoform X2 [Phyllopteryx taeniolatus]|uniref:coiled-coil domain-containing 92B-like isoform X2 n=1 Tax=Phyllopteryx taeniolatus TaxID=161469 RepID=UPI002AD20331|nr:coiled-coil domain-containing 92B-like isoform X2 [Phyllopteryx taeniolatus]